MVGGTRLKGGVGRIWGTIAGALILEVIGNIMLLSNLVSEYLIGAVQGAIIIIAMLAQRGMSREPMRKTGRLGAPAPRLLKKWETKR